MKRWPKAEPTRSSVQGDKQAYAVQDSAVVTSGGVGSMQNIPAREGKTPTHYLWLALLALALEKSCITYVDHPWVNNHYFRGTPLVFTLALFLFGRDKLRTFWAERPPFRPKYAALHAGILAAVSALEFTLRSAHLVNSSILYRICTWLWILLLVPLVLSLMLAFAPVAKLLSLARRLTRPLLYCVVLSIFVAVAREKIYVSWYAPSTRIAYALQTASFGSAEHLLRFVYPVVYADPPNHVLGTDKFVVEIAAGCSGLEGLALTLAFTSIWILFSRKKIRVVRAFALLPMALLLMLCLNIVRIVALIAIGDAGHPKVAVNGFHSAAGWLAFNLVNFGFLLVVTQLAWFQRRPRPGVIDGSAVNVRTSLRNNVAAVYLAPFLAITLTALLSQAATASFDWLYPLRLPAVLLVLWFFRAEYRRMNWRFSYRGILLGLLVGAVWLGSHYWRIGWKTTTQDSALVASLHSVPAIERLGWLVCRTIAAVLTVPVAEELAFRGFVARRVMDPDVDAVPFKNLSVAAIAISSVVFGLLHTEMVVPGILAGVVFALIAKRENRLGEAVAAHAVANLVIACVVLLHGSYSLW